jgi:hypothetical protein
MKNIKLLLLITFIGATGCDRAYERLTGQSSTSESTNNAVVAQEETLDAQPSISKFWFKAVVLQPTGAVGYYSDIRPGDVITGTFEINLNSKVIHINTDGSKIYAEALQNMRGIMKNYQFTTPAGRKEPLIVSRRGISTAPEGMIVLNNGFRLPYGLGISAGSDIYPNVSIKNFSDIDMSKMKYMHMYFVSGQVYFSADITYINKVAYP